MKVDLFSEEDNVLKIFVRKVYSIVPQDIEITFPKIEAKTNGSQLTKQKNGLYKEMSQFCNKFGKEMLENNMPMTSTENQDGPLDIKKEFTERKRKFDNRPNHVKVPLETFFDFQEKMKVLEEYTDLSFA